MVVVAVGDDRSGVDCHVLADEHVVDPHLGEQVVKVGSARRRTVCGGRRVAGIDEATAVREFVSRSALVGRFANDAVEVAHQHRGCVPGDRIEVVEYQLDPRNPCVSTLMIEMCVQTQQVIVGVAVTKAGPGRYTGIGGVPADAARLGGLFGEPERVRGRAVEAFGPVTDGRVLPAGVNGVTRVSDPLIAVKQHL